MNTSNTFHDGRHCKHCGRPIPDQSHDSRDFCPREVLPDGSIKSCKDDYHSDERQKSEPPYRAATAFQKKMTGAIEALLMEKGPLVSVEEVNRRGIKLASAVETILEEPWPQFVFVHYSLALVSSNEIKISTRENSLL